jgi:hypothetical protein
MNLRRDSRNNLKRPVYVVSSMGGATGICQLRGINKVVWFDVYLTTLYKLW